MIKELINKVVSKDDLSLEEAKQAMEEIMNGDATPAQIASFITALRMKGETVEEITGFAQVMRQKVNRVYVKKPLLVDTCGTGGDNAHTFNISTISALVASGAGVVVAKHGNRAVSSRSGSADVLKELGVNIEVRPEKVAECIEYAGIGFLFAPTFHPAMKYAIGPRREIGIRTVFNILGPLTNPLEAKAQVLGVYDAKLTETLAEVLRNLGSSHVFVVHGSNGIDEITTTGKTFITELKDGSIRSFTIHPSDFGIPEADISELLGGTPQENAQIAIDILNGQKGPKRDIVLLNASAAIVAGGKAENLSAGIELAVESIDSGKAMEKLELLREITNS